MSHDPLASYDHMRSIPPWRRRALVNYRMRFIATTFCWDKNKHKRSHLVASSIKLDHYRTCHCCAYPRLWERYLGQRP